jgi:uncharacterized protein YjbJ (UPF0337 family)
VAEVSQELRQDIERIRDDLDDTLDALGERVSPRRIAQRRKAAVRTGVTRVRTAVMGSAQDTGSKAAGQARHAKESVQETAGHAAEKVRDAPEVIQQQTQGNPLAAGLVAFGAGMLLATLFPPTEAEQRAASAVQERAEPLKDRAMEAGKEMKDHLQQSSQARAEQVKETAKGAAEEVKGQAQSSAEEVKGQAKSSAESVKKEAGPGKGDRP